MAKGRGIRRKRGMPSDCGHSPHFAKGFCKKCYRKQPHVVAQEASYRRRYGFRRKGLSREEFDAALERQGGRCAICGRSDSGSRKETHWRLFVDHDHTTGEPRGLLCHRCNLGLGYLPSARLLRTAVAYLERPGMCFLPSCDGDDSSEGDDWVRGDEREADAWSADCA